MSLGLLNYAPSQKYRWRQWLHRYRWLLVAAAILLIVWRCQHWRPWYIAYTEDQWQSFSAVRTTRLGFGPVCLYADKSTVPFERADLVDPLPSAVFGATNPVRSYRDVRNYQYFGFRVRCFPGLYRFHTVQHAALFVEEYAMDLDRPTRTRLAKAIAEANVGYEGKFSDVLPAANAKAERLLKDLRNLP